MTGRATTYNCMLMLCWVNVNLFAHSSVTMDSKLEGDEETTKAWKEHDGDCRLMHKKIDVIEAHMDIPFYPIRMVQEGEESP